MPFATPLAVAIYFTIWWIVLLALLPMGSDSYHETDQHTPAGGDPSAPVAPKLAMKAALTTVVSAIVFGIVVLIGNYVPFD